MGRHFRAARFTSITRGFYFTSADILRDLLHI